MLQVVPVDLTHLELMHGAMHGVIRQMQALRADSTPEAGAGSSADWQYHIEGCLGEMAFAKHLGIYWTGCSVRAARDVGKWEVRTRSRHDYELIIREKDPDDRRFVLVTGCNGRYVVRGWYLAAEAKCHLEWWQEHGGRPGAWFVPQSALSMDFGKAW